MDEYNIEQHHLQEKPPEPINQATSLPDLKFVGILIMGIAKLNHCWPHIRRNAFGENEIFLVGTPENISVVQDKAHYTKEIAPPTKHERQ